MEASNYLKAVRDQYEAFPYPPRNPADEKVRLENSWHDFLELINFYCFKGRNNFSQECRVLVAGGGTGDQTIFLAEQLRYNRRAEVVHLDISEKCNEIAKRRAEVRKLVNITWVRGSVLDLPSLKLGPFDYINCVGVLHHLEDPKAGLQALRSVLKADGAISLMLYGKYGRTGVYQLQELLRRLNFDETDLEAKLANTKSCWTACRRRTGSSAAKPSSGTTRNSATPASWTCCCTRRTGPSPSTNCTTWSKAATCA